MEKTISVPELIDNIYNRNDGKSVYASILKHFGRHFDTPEEAADFTNQLLCQCLPVTMVVEISISSLVSLASKLVTETKKLKIYNQQGVISFIHNSCLKKSREIYTHPDRATRELFSVISGENNEKHS